MIRPRLLSAAAWSSRFYPSNILKNRAGPWSSWPCATKCWGYILDIVRATRSHEAILVGAGPRATQSLLLAARANAALAGNDFISPDDVRGMVQPVLEHRLILRPEYEIEGLSIAEVLQRILQTVSRTTMIVPRPPP